MIWTTGAGFLLGSYVWAESLDIISSNNLVDYKYETRQEISPLTKKLIDFDEQVLVSSLDVIAEQQKDELFRTEKSVTTRNGETLKTVFYTDKPFVYRNGNWWEVGYYWVDKTLFEQKEITQSTVWGWFIPSVNALTTSTYSFSGDGWVRYDPGASWSTVRDASSGTDFNHVLGNNYGIYSEKSGANYMNLRSFFTFDTSVLPDNATIVSSTFQIVRSPLYNANSQNISVHLVTSTAMATSSLANSDYNKNGWANIANPIALSSTADDTPIRFSLTNTSTISLTGNTNFSLITSLDYNNVAPTGGNALSIYNSEQTGTNYDPILEIEYTLPSEPPAQTTSPTVWSYNGNVSTFTERYHNALWGLGITALFLALILAFYKVGLAVLYWWKNNF